MNAKLAGIAAATILLTAVPVTAARATSGVTLRGERVVAGDDRAALKRTWECGPRLRHGRKPHSWIRRDTFTSGTGATLVVYRMVRGRAPGRVSKDGVVANRCHLRPTWRQLGISRDRDVVPGWKA